MGKALEGVRILDFTHVQSGPTCTQLLAWFGADVIKVERPGVGDITRGQLQDVPNADSLYFTMLNHNKRSITIDSKNKKGMEILERLVRRCDVLVENFAPGALDRMGLTWERIQELNPRMVYASVKGFGPGPYEDCKVYENIAQCSVLFREFFVIFFLAFVEAHVFEQYQFAIADVDTVLPVFD